MASLIRSAAFAILTLCAPAFAPAEGRLFGLDVPRGTPEPFEPTIFAPYLQPRMAINGPAFSPDMRHFVFTVEDSSVTGQVAVTVYETTSRRGKWSRPTAIPALTAGGFGAGEGTFSRDGRWFYFSSNRPPGAADLKPRIFRAAVRPSGMGEPEFIGLEPPHGGGTFYPRPISNGPTLVQGLAFTAPGAAGRDDLFVADAKGFVNPRALAGDFNTPHDEWDLVESADGALRIWVSSRPGGQGRTDIYYSRRSDAGEWSDARNLSAANSAALETAPQLTPDDRVLFFLRYSAGANRLFWVELASVLEGGP